MTAPKSFPIQNLKLGLLAGLSVLSMSVQIAQAQTPTLTGQTASGLARVYTGQTVGQLPNGMIAITLPTQVMVNGAVQILMPDYRVLTLPGGSYSVQGGTVYAQPNVLMGIGYPVPAEFSMTTSSTAQQGGSVVAGRKVLGFVPEPGTSFDTRNQDPAYGTRGLRVTRYECQVASTNQLASLSGDVAFDTNKAIIKPGAQSELSNLARQMLSMSGATFTITGHTDSRGSDSYNKSLSESRARAVVEFLANQGVPRANLSAVGAGEARPIASNDTDSGRAQNRRVEVTSSGGMVQTASQNCERVEVLEPTMTSTLATSTFGTTPGFDQQVNTLQPLPDPSFSTFTQPQMPTFDASSTFIDGSGGFSAGPAAVALGPSGGGGAGTFAVAADPFAAQAPVPVATTNSFAQANASADDGGLFGGIQQSLTDIPPALWGVASFVVVGAGYFLLATGDDDSGE